MIDSYTIFATTVMGLMFTCLIIWVPFMVSRSFLFCTACHSGKFFFQGEIREEAKEKDIKCSKCHTPMEWMELTDDLYKMWVRSWQIGYSLFYPIIFFLLLADLYSRTPAYLIFHYLLLASLITPVVGLIIIYVITKKKVRTQVATSLMWKLG